MNARKEGNTIEVKSKIINKSEENVDKSVGN